MTREDRPDLLPTGEAASSPAAALDASLDDPAAWNWLLTAELAPLALPGATRTGIRERLLQRAAESVRRHAGLITVRVCDGLWQRVMPGVRAKLLWDGPAGASVLIELSARATLPVHRHHWLEEGIVLRGRLQLGEVDLGPGDYHVSPPGSRHGRISSREGAVAYLRGTSLGKTSAALGELLGGLVPGAGPAPQTIFASEGTWQAIAPGAEQKILWHDGDIVSRFIRLAPGSRLPGHPHRADEECMMLVGDAFFGDLLLQAGEFHWAPAGSEHGAVSSDSGAELFVRGHLYG